MIIVNGWKPLTIITKRSILDVAALPDTPLVSASFFFLFFRLFMQNRYNLSILQQNYLIELLCLYCWCEKFLKDKKGEFKSDKTSFAKWNRRSWKPQKVIIGVWKLFSQCIHSWCGFFEGVLQVLFTVLWFKWSLKMYCVAKVLLAIWQKFFMKIIVTIIATDLVISLLLPFFYPFLETKNKFWFGNEKYFYFLFIASHALLQNRIQ